MSKQSATLARVRQLACLGLPGGLFVASLLPLLRGLTESESAAFFWLDESGAIANFYADHFPLQVSEWTPGCGAQESIPDAARPAFEPLSLAVLATTIEDEAPGHGWYQRILQRTGAYYILHGTARGSGLTLGRLTLFRPAGARAFGLGEIAALSSVIRYVDHGLEAGRSADRHAPWGSEDAVEEEMLIADRAGHVLHATDNCRRLLLLATGCPLAPATLPLAARESQRLLRSLYHGEDGGPDGGPVTRSTIWGRFVLRAYGLEEAPRSPGAPIGVLIRRTQPAALRFVNAMNGLPFSPQQREIALLIARGHTNRDIAQRLSVSVNTVAYHIKQLFYKLRVHDRAELVARIDAVETLGGNAAAFTRPSPQPRPPGRCTASGPGRPSRRPSSVSP